MSLTGRLRYRRKGKVQATRKFEVEGDLDPAKWAEFLEKLKALLKHYGIKLTKAKDL